MPEDPELLLMDELNRLRSGGRADPVRLVSLASDAGYVRDGALEIMARFIAFRRPFGDSHTRFGDEIAAPLKTLLWELCRGQRAATVLEYVNVPNFLISHLYKEAEIFRLTFATDTTDLAEALNAVFADFEEKVILGSQNIPADARFDAVVCSPPVGKKSGEQPNCDGFGGEVVRSLAKHVGDAGWFYWMTGRGVLTAKPAQQTINALRGEGLHLMACIEIPSGSLYGASLEGVLLGFRRSAWEKRFVAALRDLETAKDTATALLTGPTRKRGPNWIWLDPEDSLSFSALEQSRLQQKLTPRGPHKMQPLGALLNADTVERADRPLTETAEPSAFLYVPEYAGSRVTADLDEQTVKPKAVYRLAIDPIKANPRFLAQLLNSPYGKHVNSLRNALNEDGAREEATQILRGLVDEIRLHPIDDQLQIELIGDLATLLGFAEKKGADNKKPGSSGDPGSTKWLVAGARNQLYLLFAAQGLMAR